jgi:hypothetical protein
MILNLVSSFFIVLGAFLLFLPEITYPASIYTTLVDFKFYIGWLFLATDVAIFYVWGHYLFHRGEAKNG